MADLLHSNFSISFLFSSLSLPLNYSPHRPFSFLRFSPLNHTFSHSSSFVAKLSSDSSLFHIVSRTENSDGSVSFKFGDVTEISPTVNGGNEFDLARDDDQEFVKNAIELKEIGKESVDFESFEDFVGDALNDGSTSTAKVENLSNSVEDDAVIYGSTSTDSVEDDAVNNGSTWTAEVENSSDSVEQELDSDSISFAEVENSSDTLKEELDSDSISIAIVEVANSSDSEVDNVVPTCDSSVVVMAEKSDQLREASEEMISMGKRKHNYETSSTVNRSFDVVTEKANVDKLEDGGGEFTISVEDRAVEDVDAIVMSEQFHEKEKEDMVGLISKQLEAEPILDQEDEDTVELMSKRTKAEPIFDEDSVLLDGVVVLGSNKVQDIITYNPTQNNYDCDDTLVAVHPTTSGITSADTSLKSLDKEESLALAMSISSAVASLSNSLEALTGGKDASFVYNNWFGVADGVGQWSFGGVNAGLYAHEFMQNCEQLLKSESAGLTNVKKLFQQSAAMTQSTGLARVLIAHVANRVLHVANIGDSGFLIVRNGTIFRKSSPMVHEFSFPYAIGLGDDSVEDVEEYHVDLEEGDVIITATDGLFDNLYEQEIASIVSKSVEAGTHLQDLAKLLASKAQEVGRSESARSPFADAAQAAGHSEFNGGKFDHVTVIVSLVQR